MHLHKFDNYRELFSVRAGLEIGIEVLINYPVFIHSSVSSISIGDKSVIGESVVFGSSTLIGSNDYDGIVIGEGCVIGADTKIADGVKIGGYSMIQDNGLVMENVVERSWVERNKAPTNHIPAPGAEKARARILSRQSDEDMFKLANFELENLNYDDAKKRYMELLDKERRPEVLHNLALAHIASGDRKTGEEYLKESLEKHESYLDAKRSLANMLLFEAEGLHLPLTERFIRTSIIFVR